MKFTFYDFCTLVYCALGAIVLLGTNNLPVSLFFFGFGALWQIAGCVVCDLKGKK